MMKPTIPTDTGAVTALLRAADPVADELLASGLDARARADLLAIHADSVAARTTERTRRAAPRSLSRRWVFVPATATAVVAAVAFAVSYGVQGGTGDGSTELRAAPVSAVSFLNGAADEVRDRSAATPADSDWIYRKTLHSNFGEAVKANERWDRYDGKRFAWDLGDGVIESDEDHGPGIPLLGLPKYDCQPDAVRCDHDLSEKGLQPLFMSPVEHQKYMTALPTDPQELLEQVSGGGTASERNERAFGVLSGLLMMGFVTSPDVHAAVFEALAKIPGMALERRAEDVSGRTGTGVRWAPSSDRAVVVIIDPQDYSFLGYEVHEGTEKVASMAQVAVGVVAEAGARP